MKSFPLKTLLSRLFRVLFQNKKFALGMIILLALSLISVVGSFLIPYNVLRLGTFQREMAPVFPEHILGTDSTGRDVLGQLFIAILNSMEIGFIVAIFGTAVGCLIGFIAGYYGDNASIGLDPCWQEIACRAFMRYGNYAASILEGAS